MIVKRLDGSFRRCGKPATDVDHIRRGDDHTLKNLRPACTECHNRKSGQEGAAARYRHRARATLPPEPHPAELWRLQQGESAPRGARSAMD
ncbi:HNH endonuclease signature motif containing protein [Salinispora tropica]|uniref:HNH endonuclease n=1 Tax=Salinispora tropica TaxID=168695 RepID=UPI0019308CEB